MILRAGRSDWWIETELQNRFQGQCEKEFGILGSDDGMAGFLGWGGNGIWTGVYAFAILRNDMKFQ